MFSKKQDIITATRCELIEAVRLALEVQSGQRVRLHQLDFKQKCFFYIGIVSRRVAFCGYDGTRMDFGITDDEGKLTWYIARFEEEGRQVRVIEMYGLSQNGEPMWWVGRSYHDRRQEPLYQ